MIEINGKGLVSEIAIPDNHSISNIYSEEDSEFLLLYGKNLEFDKLEYLLYLEGVMEYVL